MQKTFIVSVYPRFNGMYYTVMFPDFEDFRAKNLYPEEYADRELSITLITRELQAFVNDWIIKGNPLPEPQFKEYDNFTSDYNNNILYLPITINLDPTVKSALKG